MIESLANIFADYGGLIGLVVLALFVLVAYQIKQQAKMAERLLQAIEENDKRLIDFKREHYKANHLPDRRGNDR